MTSFTPGLVMSLTEVMWAGSFLGTIKTSRLVANSTGLSISCFAYRAAGCFGLAAANTSAGAPCSICVSSRPEPPNVYFALGSIIGKTLVSDAAANTVGWGAVDALRPAVGDVLPPHPPSSADTATAATHRLIGAFASILSLY